MVQGVAHRPGQGLAEHVALKRGQIVVVPGGPSATAMRGDVRLDPFAAFDLIVFVLLGGEEVGIN